MRDYKKELEYDINYLKEQLEEHADDVNVVNYLRGRLDATEYLRDNLD